MSKGSSKPSILRRSRDRTKTQNFKNDPFSSGVNSSKSPENMLKKKRKSPGIGGSEKDSKDMMKQIEQKIDDLRKSSYAEINRIESMMERNQQEQKEHIAQIGTTFKYGQDDV